MITKFGSLGFMGNLTFNHGSIKNRAPKEFKVMEEKRMRAKGEAEKSKKTQRTDFEEPFKLLETK